MADPTGLLGSGGGSGSTWTDLIAVAIILAASYGAGWLMAYFVRKLWLLPRKVELSTDLLITRAIKYTVTILGSLIALAWININILPLIMGLGVLGLAIAFGVQEIVANMISGLIIMVDRPIKSGDVVEVEGATGKVVDVGLRASTVRTLDNINVLVPNKLIILNKITNYTKHDPKIRLRIPVGVAYGSDMAKVKKILLSIAAGHPKVLDEPAPDARMEEFGNSSVNFTLYAWIDDAPSRFQIKDEINWEINEQFKKGKITIPFPQVDIWMRK
jgi:small-conductance mechanosensitive channel